MKALTLHRPWSDAIAYLPEGVAKRIENRTWGPPWSARGQRIAIHAGKAFDERGRASIEALLTEIADGWGEACTGDPAALAQEDRPAFPSGAGESPMGVVATAAVVGAVRGSDRVDWFLPRRSDGLVVPEPQVRRWWTGHVGWVLDDVVPLPAIPCRGRQGLWQLPRDVEERVFELEALVRAGTVDPRPRYIRVPERAAELRALDEVAFYRRRRDVGARHQISPEGLAGIEIAREDSRRRT